MIRNKLKLQAGKTYTVNDASSTYTIIVGDMREAADTSTEDTVSNLRIGAGAPSPESGKIGGVYLDHINKRVHVKDATGWDSGFSLEGSGGSSEFKVGVGAPSLNLSSSISSYIDMQSMTFHTRSGGSWDEGRLMRGSAGTNGKSVRFGNGPPISSLGENDETYIDLNDFKIHTKSSGTWSNGQVFKGSNGQNGKSLRFGNGLPSDNDGEDDEVYLDLSNFKVHSKSAGSWGSGHVFKGDNGQDGLNGKSVRFGNGAPSDSTGDDDEIYFDLNDFKLHTKSSGYWDSGSVFKGSDGAPGLNGKSLRFGNGSPSDSDGDDDEVYLDLSNFKIHSKSAGSWGSGHAFKGSDGLNGSNGLNGKSIKFGSGLPTDSDGEDDEVYLDISNFKIHTKATGSWSAGVAFKGANGNDGSNGKDGSDGSPGKDGVTAQLTNDSDVIPTDSDGTGYDFTDTGGEFELRSGGTKITSGVTYYAGAAGTSSSVVVNGLTLSITSGGVYSLSGASWSQPFAKFTMRAIHEGVTYTKVYKVTKARSGIKGGDGLNGSDGINGKDGTNGTDAVTGHLSNDADVLSASSDGTGYSFAGTGGTFYVYSGKTQVSPSNFYVGAAGTATSQTIGGLTLSITSGGVYSLSGASWTTDSVSFTLRAIYSGVTLSKIYKITKSKAGSKGDQGIKGDIGATGPGVKVYSVALGSDSSTADVQLTTSYADMYLADVMTNEGNILTASSTKGGSTTFTINQSGRYKIELQAAFRIKNVTKGTTYSATCYAQILKNGVATWSANTGALSTTLAAYAVASASYESSTVSITKTVFLASGTVLKMQAKTSSTSGGASYLELATDSETQTAEDTILTITKL